MKMKMVFKVITKIVWIMDVIFQNDYHVKHGVIQYCSATKNLVNGVESQIRGSIGGEMSYK